MQNIEKERKCMTLIRETKCKTLIENAKLRGKTISQVKVRVSYMKTQMRFFTKMNRDKNKGVAGRWLTISYVGRQKDTN